MDVPLTEKSREGVLAASVRSSPAWGNRHYCQQVDRFRGGAAQPLHRIHKHHTNDRSTDSTFDHLLFIASILEERGPPLSNPQGQKEVVALICGVRTLPMSMRPRKAIIPVAGFGTRVLPASKSIPKELLTVVDRPLIHYIMEEALEAGIEHLCFVTGRGKSAIEDYFDHQFELERALEAKKKTEILNMTLESVLEAGRTSFTRQQAALGLGHAVWCGRDIVGDEPFAVILPDVIIKGQPKALKEMMDRYEDGANIIAVEEVPHEETSKYGIIAPKGAWENGAVEMSGMVEKPAPADAPSNYSITGRYILQPEIFDLLASQEPGAGNEVQLTDSMDKLLEMQKFKAVTFSGESHDCGFIEGYVKANIAFGMDHPKIGDSLKDFVRERI